MARYCSQPEFMEPEDALEGGDVVQLKGGGPLMTVEGGRDEIACVWFDQAGALHRDRFRAGTLLVRARPLEKIND